MRNIILIILSCIGLQNCCATSITKLPSDETLIANNYKIIEHGFFTFLVCVNENKVKELIYVYSIDIKNKKVTCSKSSERIYSIPGKDKYSKKNDLKTAADFKRTQNNTWRERYYTCFADNFLDMNNDMKINLLNKLSEK